MRAFACPLSYKKHPFKRPLMPHNIAILGSTGSIGTQTLDVISRFPERFKATILAAGSKVDQLIEQAIAFRPSLAIIADETKYGRLCEALSPLGIECAAGPVARHQAPCTITLKSHTGRLRTLRNLPVSCRRRQRNGQQAHNHSLRRSLPHQKPRRDSQCHRRAGSPPSPLAPNTPSTRLPCSTRHLKSSKPAGSST